MGGANTSIRSQRRQPPASTGRYVPSNPNGDNTHGVQPTQILPPSMFSFGLTRDLRSVIAGLPSLPTFSPAAPVSTPHCLEQGVTQLSESVQREVAQPFSLLRSLVLQLTQGNQHTVFEAFMNPGHYANGVEVRTATMIHADTRIRNGELSGEVTFTPPLIQHDPHTRLPGIGRFAVPILDAIGIQKITLTTSGEQLHAIGTLSLPGGFTMEQDITEELTPTLFGHVERTIQGSLENIVERAARHFATLTPNQLTQYNMVDPMTARFRFVANDVQADSTLPAVGDVSHARHHFDRLEPIPGLVISGIDGDLELTPVRDDRGAAGFRITSNHSTIDSITYRPTGNCAGQAMRPITLNNLGARDLNLEIFFRNPNNPAEGIYVRSGSVTLPGLEADLMGDVISHADTDHPAVLTLSNGTPEGQLSAALQTTPLNVERIAVNVQGLAGTVNTTIADVTSSVVTYNLDLTNIFDPARATVNISSSNGNPETLIAEVDISGTALRGYSVRAEGIVNRAQALTASMSINEFNPLGLLALDPETLSAETLLASITGNPNVTFRATQSQSGLSSVTFSNPQGEVLASYASAPMICGAFSVSANNVDGVNAALTQCRQPTSTTQFNYYEGDRILSFKNILGPTKMDFSLGLSRSGQTSIGLNIPTFNTTTRLFASAGFLGWARSLLPRDMAQRVSRLPLRSVALSSEVTAGPGGISVTTNDQGRTHQAHVGVRTRNNVRAAGVRVVTRDEITADISVRDQAAHAGVGLPQFAFAAGSNRVRLDHTATVSAAGQRLTLAGRTVLSDTPAGRISASDIGSLSVPAFGINNDSTLTLATTFPVNDGVYTQIPTSLRLSGRLHSRAAAHQRDLPHNVTLSGSLTADNRFTIDLPSGAFHDRGTSDLQLNAGIATGEGNGIVNIDVRDHACLQANVASPGRLSINDQTAVRVTTNGDIQAMTPAGEVRLLGGVDVPLATEGGGARIRINTLDGTTRALRAWGVGTHPTSHRNGRRGMPHGSH